MITVRLFAVAVLALLLVPAPRAALAGTHTDGTRFVPDVAGQFRSLTEIAEPLGFRLGGSPDPSSCKHYQGIVRVDGADGTPFFLVTRSGNLPPVIAGPVDPALCDDSPGETGNGHLIVFRLDSRDKNGERLRSDRLAKGVHVDNTPPPLEDAASIYFTLVEDGLVFQDGPSPHRPQRGYQHPGGMQVVGHMLALVVEHPRPVSLFDPNYVVASHESLVMFFDVSDPEAPRFTSSFSPEDEVGGAAGVVGIAPLPGGLYLMVITGGSDNEYFTFYRSTHSDLSSVALDWNLVARISSPSTQDTHQTLNFLREGNIDGDLYLAGARGTADPTKSDHDRIDLYRVTCDTDDCAPGEQVGLTVRYNGQRITPVPTTFGKSLANLAAASSFYVSPSGELIFYAADHDNDGPSSTGTVGEWRHREVVRFDSPTLLPSAVLGGPYQVDEGDSIVVTGSAEHALTRAWIQLFSGTGFTGTYPVVDYADHDLDDFDDLEKIKFLSIVPPGLPNLHHADRARSWSWFAPEGCSIVAKDFEGGVERTLLGTGAVVTEPELSQVFDDSGSDDMDMKVDGVDFGSECDSYYGQSIDLFWDLDSDGTYETMGLAVTFDAAALDGPSLFSVSAEARHPFGGPAGSNSASVTVNNVAPAVDPLVVTDSAGNRVPTDVPFVLLGLPIDVFAGFTDPGLPDHQTAVIDWGDGFVDDDTSVAMFDEAFGDGTGSVGHSHSYAVPGAFEIVVSVSDDDGDAGEARTTVDVLTPEQAVEAAVDLLDDLIAAEPNGSVRRILQKARISLFGNPGAMNGALKMLKKGNDAAALAFLDRAIAWLERAGDAGADTAQLIALLEQIIASLSAP